MLQDEIEENDFSKELLQREKEFHKKNKLVTTKVNVAFKNIQSMVEEGKEMLEKSKAKPVPIQSMEDDGSDVDGLGKRKARKNSAGKDKILDHNEKAQDLTDLGKSINETVIGAGTFHLTKKQPFDS
jgi:hypothetical protein